MKNTCSNIIELRQYTLHPGARESLIALFDREFVESQEAEGIDIIGQFRDLGDPDRFVWLRGFPDMETRRKALASFYGGPVWKAHRDAANATMLDSDNVLLLRPVDCASGFALDGVKRPPPNARGTDAGVIVLVIVYLMTPADVGFLKTLADEIVPALNRAGAPVFAKLVTDPTENNFPVLPVRAGENVFVWLSSEAVLGSIREWPRSLASRFSRPPEALRLEPTPRSKLRVRGT